LLINRLVRITFDDVVQSGFLYGKGWLFWLDLCILA
jgi:hypothetical protein